MSDDYKPGRAIVAGALLGAFIGLMTRRLVVGTIIGFGIGLFIEGSNKAKRERE
jgi:hypothetical protein